MKYEIVDLKEQIIVGLKARTKNSDPNMQKTIGGLWETFFSKGIYEHIDNKAGNTTVGLYDHYESDMNGEYDITVGTAVIKAGQLPEGVVVKKIPAGKYAKFVIKGHMQKAVAAFWSELWKMDLKRTYTADFEEYMNTSIENAEIDVYIAIEE